MRRILSWIGLGEDPGLRRIVQLARPARRARIFRTAILLAALIVALTPAPVSAQAASAGAVLQSYLATDAESVRFRSLRLITIPFDVRLPLAGWADLSIGGAFADAALTLADGETGGVRGLTDTRVRLVGRWGGLALTGTALLATGEVPQSLEESTVVGLLSSDLLPFAVLQWGTGGGYGADLAYTYGAGRTILNVSGGYQAVNASTPPNATALYRPGSEVRARALLDVGIGAASELSVAVGLQRYDEDTYAEENLFTPGNRLGGLASFAFPLGSRESARVFGGFYHRSAGSVGWISRSGRDDYVGGLLPGASRPISRDLLVAGVETRFSRRTFDVAPRGEIRLLRNDSGLGQGWLISAGGALAYRLRGERFGRRVLLQPRAALRIGRLTASEGYDSHVVGFELGATVHWEGRP